MRILIILFILSTIISYPSYSQQEFIPQNEIQEIYENQPLQIQLNVIENFEIQQAFLYYRTFGRMEFSVIEMNIQGSIISATIPKDYVVFPYIEYYIKVLTTKGIVLNYPRNASETGNYFRVNVKKLESIDEQIIILSPSKDEPISQNDFFLAISLLRTSSRVKKEFTRIWINEKEVTPFLLISQDLILLPQGSIKNLKLGLNNFKVILYDSTGKPLYISDESFRVVAEEEKQIISRSKFEYTGQFRGESIYENMRSGNFNFNRINLSLNSGYGILKSTLNIYLTNEEKPTLQPQNRFLLNIDMNILKFYIGDHYPMYPTLIMNGKRLRGVTGTFELGFFNIQASYGEIVRKIEGNLIQLFSRDSAVIGSDIIPVDSSKFGQPFAKVKLGTYQRRLFAIRPYFGKGQNFQLGFTYLHSKDELSSIQFGARPKENVTVGSDLLIGIDNQRILFKAQSAFSIINNDISTGDFTDNLIDSLFGEGKPFGGDPSIIKRVRDIGKNFITINQFIVPLNPQKLPTFALDVSMSVNYFGNYFKSSYIYRGNDYTSFGQNFLRNDIKGFQVMDRIGLYDNQIFISVSYEDLKDNLQNTKLATTNFKNFESSISLYLRRNFPNFTFGYSNFRVKNDVDPINADTIRRQNYLNEITNQFSLSSNYNLKLKVPHRIFLNLITSKKQDYTDKNLSAKFLAINLSIQNFWDKSFYTFLGTNLSKSYVALSKFNYYSFSLGSSLISFNNKLRSTFSINPYFGNLKRVVIDLSNQYYFMKNFSVNMNIRYLINSRPIKNESIVNFFTQYEF